MNKPTFTRKDGITLATVVLHEPKFAAIAKLKKIENLRSGKKYERGTWESFAFIFRQFLEGKRKDPPFQVFAKDGNSKLPFHAFSSLPGFDCPGAGECLFSKGSGEMGSGWCYSFKAWRYPAAYFRQLQNSYLIRFKRELIAKAFHAIPKGQVVRLYVDGDFYSQGCFDFWMGKIAERKDLRVYGYSKSWKIILASKVYLPGNYFLNLSSGSKYGEGVKNEIAALLITRGEFIAVPVARKWITSKAYQDKGNEGSKEYRKDVLGQLRAIRKGQKVFACPGSCGNCIMGGKDHACGSGRLSGVVIGIGVHG